MFGGRSRSREWKRDGVSFLENTGTQYSVRHLALLERPLPFGVLSLHVNACHATFLFGNRLLPASRYVVEHAFLVTVLILASSYLRSVVYWKMRWFHVQRRPEPNARIIEQVGDCYAHG